ncbi:hypothetical protein GH714_018798 [Hevea brasiliensis]|uniref:RNase H type-1 domain-containing protein n=1 Tax=Hevea brasiliensis TaxID=3981 RepID=A0A6A6K6D1_HEVBR|nr:hypothetical protein GH714_018798 [Hevea brasiliensis]
MNGHVFSYHDPPRFSIDFILAKLDEVAEAQHRSSFQSIPKARHVHLIGWDPLPQGWIKLNTNGSMRNLKRTTGGLFCDSAGKWLSGFMCNLGSYDVFGAELWGIYHGFSISWNLDFKFVVVEVDSQAAVAAVLGSNAAWNRLVGLAHDYPLGVTCYDSPSPELGPMPLADSVGMFTPRLVVT